MPVSLEHNAIFIHITKTGGTSIEDLLGIHYDPKCPTKNLLHSEPAPDGPVYQHLTPSEIEEYILNKDFLKNAFRFTIVRDPWDRFVSSFEYCKKDAKNPIRSDTLDEFLIKAYDALRIGDYIHHPYHAHFRPQSDYFEDDPSYFTKVYNFSHFDQAVEDIRRRTGCIAECPHLHRGPENRPVADRNARIRFDAMYGDDIRLLQNLQQLE